MVRTAIVAGAGLAGLTAGLALARQGVEVQILEQAAELGEVGAGIQLSPNAMKVVAALGLDRQVNAAGFEPEQAVIRHHRSGRAHLSLPLRQTCRGRYGAPYVHIHRADLHEILTGQALAEGIEIKLGSAVLDYNDAPGVVSVRHCGGVEEADLLIGADGLHSAVRATMLGTDKPRFTGQVAWRGTVPVNRLPPGLVPPDATVWAGPGRHFVTYLLRGGTLANFVAVEERDTWRSESWSDLGDAGELRLAFAGFHPSVTGLLEKVTTCHLWALFDRAELPIWHRERSVLIGDACHPMLPFMAQGAAMGLEDAMCLAQRVASIENLQQALASFQAERKPRATALQQKSRNNAGLFHLSQGPGGSVARFKLAAARFLPAAWAMRQFDGIYGYDPIAAAADA